jgi:peptidoglycan/xylan/chitin deacetylase (PgdA/CDA1 family)
MHDTNITLEEAQRFYWQEVPWVLDTGDLKIINRVRRMFKEKHGTLAVYTTHLQDWLGGESVEGNIRGALWTAATGSPR